MKIKYVEQDGNKFVNVKDILLILYSFKNNEDTLENIIEQFKELDGK